MASAAEQKRPRFSVVAPVYNKRPHLARSIGSVLGQSLDDFELILVDDGSSDGSLEEMRRLNDPRILVLESETGAPTGPGAARNRGVAAARAAWVAFLDADDEWHPEHLAELDRIIEAVPGAGIVGTQWKIEGDLRAHCTKWERGDNGSISDHEAPEPLDLVGFLRDSIAGDSPFCTSTVALRRDTLAAIGGFPEGRARRGEDVDTWLRAMAEAGTGARSRRMTAIYHRDSVNMVTRTQGFNGGAEWRTIAAQIARARDPAIRLLLQRFSNMRMIAGYLQAAEAVGHVEEALGPYLYREALTPKQHLFLALTTLPAPLWLPVYRLSHLPRRIGRLRRAAAGG